MSTKYKGTVVEIQSLNALINLVRAAESVSSRIMQRSPVSCCEHLTESQFGVLECLYHLGPMCQKMIAGKILKSGSNMTFVIDNLEKRGLVQRVDDPKDRRFYQIRLSEKGRKLISKVFPEHVKIVVEEMSALSGTEKETLRKLCRKLGRQCQTKEGG